MTSVPTIFLIDDDAAVLKAIARVLMAEGFHVQSFASAREYLDQYQAAIRGCLVLDVDMPGMNGLQLQEALAARGDAPPVVFLSGRSEIPHSVRAMKQGADEFLCKPVDRQVLIDAVKHALERDHADTAARAEVAEVRARIARLTAREYEVLGHVASGLLNKQIADRLGTVEKTIKVHRARVMEKMEVRSVAALVKLAERAGLEFTPER